MPRDDNSYLARDRAAWRSWLAAHHDQAQAIWLVLYKKKTGKPCVDYSAAVEEALCFGWIDGKIRRLDDEQYAVRFTPRRPDSIWSELNKKRVRVMIKEGQMTEAGMARVREAKRNGQWRAASVREKDDRLPEDLLQALAAHPEAQANFMRFAPSYQRLYGAWVRDAKQAATRERRIQEVVKRSAANKKPGIDL